MPNVNSLLDLIQQVCESSEKMREHRRRGTLLLSIKNQELSLALLSGDPKKIEAARQDSIDAYTAVVDSTISNYAAIDLLQKKVNEYGQSLEGKL